VYIKLERANPEQDRIALAIDLKMPKQWELKMEA
jgi:hypothetical protein